jgi:hypothetical protein
MQTNFYHKTFCSQHETQYSVTAFCSDDYVGSKQAASASSKRGWHNNEACCIVVDTSFIRRSVHLLCSLHLVFTCIYLSRSLDALSCVISYLLVLLYKDILMAGYSRSSRTQLTAHRLLKLSALDLHEVRSSVYSMLISSTSKYKVASGGITPPVYNSMRKCTSNIMRIGVVSTHYSASPV